MRILYELIGAGVLLALVYAGVVQVTALLSERKQPLKKDDPK